MTKIHLFSAHSLQSVIIAGIQKPTDFKALFLYGLTLFFSAYLLFQVQPMMGKMTLGLAAQPQSELLHALFTSPAVAGLS